MASSAKLMPEWGFSNTHVFSIRPVPAFLYLGPLARSSAPQSTKMGKASVLLFSEGEEPPQLETCVLGDKTFLVSRKAPQVTNVSKWVNLQIQNLWIAVIRSDFPQFTHPEDARSPSLDTGARVTVSNVDIAGEMSAKETQREMESLHRGTWMRQQIKSSKCKMRAVRNNNGQRRKDAEEPIRSSSEMKKVGGPWGYLVKLILLKKL